MIDIAAHLSILLLTTSGLGQQSHNFPAWNVPTRGFPTDSRRPDLHEQQVFAKVYCAAFVQGECKVETFDGSVFYHRLVSTSIVYGSFSKAGKREALVTNCVAESDVCNLVTLFRREGERWLAVHRTQGVTPRDCLKFRRADGRDMLACRGNTTFLPDFGLSLDRVVVGEKRTYQKPLLPTQNLDCRDVAQAVGLPRLGAWAKRDVNGDGYLDLKVEIREYSLSFANRQACEHLQPSKVSGRSTNLTWYVQRNDFVPHP